MIDGRTQLVGLLGWPVEHSVSPAMHNAAFEALGLNWRYVPLPVRPGQVEGAVRGLVALGFLGANVTVPHKEAALAAVDTADPSARAVGAVNTLLVDRATAGPPRVGGHNTDVQGFLGALRAGGYLPGSGGSAIVVGAGGAARAVVYGLLSLSDEKVLVLNRGVERARLLVSEMGSRAESSGRLSALPLTTETLVESARRSTLLVNATTVGLVPDAERSIWPLGVPLPRGLTVFDLVYNPPETALVRQARASGARVIGGMEMLVLQGALAFDLWTSHAYDLDEVASVMRDVCRQQLQA